MSGAGQHQSGNDGRPATAMRHRPSIDSVLAELVDGVLEERAHNRAAIAQLTERAFDAEREAIKLRAIAATRLDRDVDALNLLRAMQSARQTLESSGRYRARINRALKIIDRAIRAAELIGGKEGGKS